MPKKFTVVRRGPHSLADGSSVSEGEEVTFSAEDERENAHLIDGGALAPTSEVKADQKQAEQADEGGAQDG